MASIIKANQLQDFGGNSILTSDGAGNVTLSSGMQTAVQSAGGTNTPTFSAYLSSDQSISSSTYTKVQFNTELFDTDNAYDNSTNYRFTVPSGKNGKYFVTSTLNCRSASDNVTVASISIYKNGSIFQQLSINSNGTGNAAFRDYGFTNSYIMDLAVSDYIEIFAYIIGTSPVVNAGGTGKQSSFQMTKIIE